MAMTLDDARTLAEANGWIDTFNQLLNTYGPLLVKDVTLLVSTGLSIQTVLTLLHDFGPLVLTLLARFHGNIPVGYKQLCEKKFTDFKAAPTTPIASATGAPDDFASANAEISDLITKEVQAIKTSCPA